MDDSPELHGPADCRALVLQFVLDRFASLRTMVPAYVERRFQVPLDPSFALKRLIIAETQDGEPATDYIGTAFSAKWLYEGGNLTPVALDFEYNSMYQTCTHDRLFLTPSYLFRCRGDLALVSERYGSSLKHRMRGRLRHNGPAPRFQWSTLWSNFDVVHGAELLFPPE